MSNIMYNGAVLPSGLLAETNAPHEMGFQNAFNNTTFKSGIILAVYPADHKDNWNKTIPEYDVGTIEQKYDNGPTMKTYRHCMSAQGLGSIADFFEYTLRHQTADGKHQNKTFFDPHGQTGAHVLIVCLDGNDEKGIIVGFLKHPDRKTKLDKDTVLAGEFNGVGATIKTDGSSEFYSVGKTDPLGKPLAKDFGKVSVLIEKDGSLNINNKNIKNKMTVKGEYSTEAKGSYSIKTDGTYTVSSKKDGSISSEGNLSLKAKQLLMTLSASTSLECKTFKVAASTELNVESGQISLKGSGSVKISSSSITLDGMCQLGGAGGMPMPSMNTKYMGIGAMGVPVVSNAIGPFCTKVMGS